MFDKKSNNTNFTSFLLEPREKILAEGFYLENSSNSVIITCSEGDINSIHTIEIPVWNIRKIKEIHIDTPKNLYVEFELVDDAVVKINGSKHISGSDVPEDFIFLKFVGQATISAVAFIIGLNGNYDIKVTKIIAYDKCTKIIPYKDRKQG